MNPYYKRLLYIKVEYLQLIIQSLPNIVSRVTYIYDTSYVIYI